MIDCRSPYVFNDPRNYEIKLPLKCQSGEDVTRIGYFVGSVLHKAADRTAFSRKRLVFLGKEGAERTIAEVLRDSGVTPFESDNYDSPADLIVGATRQFLLNVGVESDTANSVSADEILFPEIGEENNG